MELLPAHATEIVIPVCAVIGIAFSFYLFLGSRNIDDRELLEMEDEEWAKKECTRLTGDVSKGVTDFLVMECKFVAVFMVGFAMLIFLLLGYVERFSTHSRPCDFYPSNMCKPALAIAISFLLGALTSAFSGFLGMKITLYASAWTGLKRQNGSFRDAFRSGAAMGFLLAAIGLLGLYIAIISLKLCYGNDWEGLFEAITGYGLGASSMAFFGRTGGGIYAKAAGVCHRRCPTHRRDQSVITYNVGDIVGDIAGMGTDLFGSYAELSCAALVAASISSLGIDRDFTAICYPLLISSMGIFVCLITTLFATAFLEIKDMKDIKPALKKQLIISTILMSFGIAIVSWIALPSLFKIDDLKSGKDVKNWQLSLCVGVGLWAWAIIVLLGWADYHTRGAFSPLQKAIAKNGARILASGSAVVGGISIPNYADISIGVSFYCAATYGVASAALGMLSTIPTRLAIDAYDPISHYAERIARLARNKKPLDIDTPAAPNPSQNEDTLAATEKGLAIESTALVSIALFGAFARRAKVSFAFWDFQTLEAAVGFILGCLLSYVFSCMTMRSGERAGSTMADDRKFPTDEFLWGLFIPGALVMLTPVIVGTLFGADVLFGVLVGSLSSVLLAAGGKAIVGDPSKDTSGPPLNVRVQLMALESLVFAPFFASHGGLLLKFLQGGDRATSPLLFARADL